MNRLKKLARDPFVHFLVLGALLFTASALLGGLGDRDRTIVISEADIMRLEAMWETQYSRPPTPAERESLIENHIDEEVLFREAQKLDLGDEDIIIRRRLVQKFSFLFEDAIQVPAPTDEDLASYFDENKERFLIPAKTSFRHVYFNGDKPRAKEKAEQALAELNTGPDAGALWRKQGDPFMLQREYASRDLEQIAGFFGEGFARRAQALETGSWHGPIASAYGWHLVLVLSQSPERLPGLEEIRSAVTEDYLAGKKLEATANFRRSLKESYTVIVKDKASGASGESE